MKKAIINDMEFEIHTTEAKSVEMIRKTCNADFVQIIKALTQFTKTEFQSRNVPVVDLDTNIFYPSSNLNIRYNKNRKLAQFVKKHIKNAIENGTPFNNFNRLGKESKNEPCLSGITGEDITGHYFVYASDCPYDYLKQIYINLVKSDGYKIHEEEKEQKEQKEQLKSEIPAVLHPTANPNYDDKGNREIGYFMENVKVLKNSLNFLAGILNANRKLSEAHHCIADIEKLCTEIPNQISFIDSREVVITKEITLTEFDIEKLQKIIGHNETEKVLDFFGIILP